MDSNQAFFTCDYRLAQYLLFRRHYCTPIVAIGAPAKFSFTETPALLADVREFLAGGVRANVLEIIRAGDILRQTKREAYRLAALKATNSEIGQ